MSGLLALLDDVAVIAKVAASSVDDVIAQATKAGAKAAGALIDDAAVTPKYVHGFSADRELPIVGRIAWGSIKNKLLILLPAALFLSAFAPVVVPYLLMLGGAYLCFEGAEKIAHSFHAGETHADATGEPGQLEEQKVQGAIKTDFILSAEIMTIALAAIETDNFWMKAAVLFVVAIGITVLVYGAVAVIVKADDVGLRMAKSGVGPISALGRGIVAGMPGFLKALTLVGTAAMLWVGGSIIVHGLKDLSVTGIYGWIHDVALAAAHAVPASFEGAVEWIVTAGLDGIIGLALGLLLIPVVTKVIVPVYGKLRPAK